MAQTPPPLLSGGCFCGAHSYTSTSLPTSIAHCHCLTCRTVHAAPFATYAEYHLSTLRFFSRPPNTPPKIVRFSPLATRAFCPNCSTVLWMQYDCDPGMISIPVATIDERRLTVALPPVKAHIFVGQKAGWWEIPDDGLPQFEGFSDPEFREKVEAFWREREREMASRR